ncbi:ABC transporter ATP-binding protein [Phaeobacter sp. HF9A]|uniref:ABC transporter ATP-binding protein n=1 Tax=Phaeobacter sp. HF9A TaxID=2721561 RepID=UPI00143198B7|nr:ABC transporter ATP-binding protein [Phaeobacter sp. HF9A]NIZ12339.1 ABC transporter ATP-binding protein [Phaeobacter sp. HF9A]
MTISLRIDSLSAWHDQFQALRDVSLALEPGQSLALVGANGAGKSTLLRLLCGLVPNWQGEITLDGKPLARGNPRAASSAGLALVPEGRLLFDSLTVEENLLVGQSARKGPWDLATVYTLFPVLAERRLQRPSTLSGGQQQMLAIGRALSANPDILLCDEISLGLSPLVVGEVYAALAQVRAQGVSLVIVDQDVSRACAAADQVVCLLEGRVSHQSAAQGVTAAALKAAYFGVATEQ